MRMRRAVLTLGAAVALFATAAGEARAAPATVIEVSPGEGALQAALDAAEPARCCGLRRAFILGSSSSSGR